MSEASTTKDKAVELAIEFAHYWQSLGEYKLARSCMEWAHRIKAQ